MIKHSFAFNIKFTDQIRLRVLKSESSCNFKLPRNRLFRTDLLYCGCDKKSLKCSNYEQVFVGEPNATTVIDWLFERNSLFMHQFLFHVFLNAEPIQYSNSDSESNSIHLLQSVLHSTSFVMFFCTVFDSVELYIHFSFGKVPSSSNISFAS